MLRLMLLRHAKSDWSVPGTRDIDRALNARGRDAAPRVGAYLAAHGLTPSVVLVSTAARTRETWTLVADRLRRAPVVQFHEEIYEAPPRAILALVKGVPAIGPNLLVVGHNPGLQGLAMTLIGGGDADALTRLSAKFPTAGLAVIDFACSRWCDIRPGTGRLERFVTPRALAEAGSTVT